MKNENKLMYKKFKKNLKFQLKNHKNEKLCIASIRIKSDRVKYNKTHSDDKRNTHTYIHKTTKHIFEAASSFGFKERHERKQETFLKNFVNIK